MLEPGWAGKGSALGGGGGGNGGEVGGEGRNGALAEISFALRPGLPASALSEETLGGTGGRWAVAPPRDVLPVGPSSEGLNDTLLFLGGCAAILGGRGGPRRRLQPQHGHGQFSSSCRGNLASCS